MRTLLAVLLFALGFGAFAQQDLADPALWFFLSRAKAEAGDKDGAIAAMEKVAELGDGFVPAPQLGFAKVWDDPRFKDVVARIESKLPRLDYAPVEFELEDREFIPEGLAYDAKAGNFFMGSIAKHQILRIDSHHAVSEFAGAGAGLDSVLGIAIDAPRRRLYAVSTSALTEQGEKRLRNAVVAFDVDTGKLLQRYDVPAARQLNDVTVAFGGRVYASDSKSGAVFELRADGPARQLVAASVVPGANGLAASPDAKRLYVAHNTGLAVVDTASGALKRMANRTRENVAAIDGLYEYEGDLIGVQSTTTPGRVIRITLSRDGEEITQVRTLLSHHHSRLFEPTTGAARADKGYFYLLSVTGVGHYTRSGKIDDPESIPNPTVLRVLLSH